MIKLLESCSNFSSPEAYIKHVIKMVDCYFDNDISEKLYLLTLQNFCEAFFTAKCDMLTFCDILDLDDDFDPVAIADFTLHHIIAMENLLNDSRKNGISCDYDELSIYLENRYDFFEKIKDFNLFVADCNDKEAVKKEIMKIGNGLICICNEDRLLHQYFIYVFEKKIIFQEGGGDYLEKFNTKNETEAYALIKKIFKDPLSQDNVLKQ